MLRGILLSACLAITACSVDSSNPEKVFDHAFGEAPPGGLVVVNGYHWQNRHLIVFYEEMWRLQLRGPNIMDFLKSRWPDLKPWRGGWDQELPETPWYLPKHPDAYEAWDSARDPNVSVRRDKATGDVFVSYTAL